MGKASFLPKKSITCPKSVKLIPVPFPALLRALYPRLLRLALRFTIAALVFIAILYCSLRAYTGYLAHRAVSLLAEAARIQVGATEDSILPLVARYGGVKWVPETPVPIDDCPTERTASTITRICPTTPTMSVSRPSMSFPRRTGKPVASIAPLSP